jgi:regulatory protein YycI of two-component signal transduction system YycFG
VKLEKVSREDVERVDNGKVVERKPVLVDVIFRRYISGMPLIGPGGEIEVFLGENGEVLGYLKPWKKIEYDKDIELISAREAYEKLKRWEVENKPTEPLKLTVIKVEAGYYAKPVGYSGQKYYEPVWIFHCKDEFNNILRLAVKAARQ